MILFVSASLAPLCLGCSIGYSSPAGAALMSNNTNEDFHLNNTQSSWFSSSVNLGCFVGCYLGSIMLNKIGRRGTLITIAFPWIAGWAIIGRCNLKSK